MPPLRTKLIGLASTLGFSPYQLKATIEHLPAFYRQAREYQRLPHDGFPLLRENLEPVLTDLTAQAGISRGHYFHQDLWAARRIFKRAPASHLDVGSRVDGFVAHVLTFMPVSVIDIRPLESEVDGLSFVRGDATRLTQANNSVESLSSLHAVEHIGLGRYGDALDPAGWKKALAEFTRVLAPGGYLYLSVPIGRQRLCFNAHRVFKPSTILDACAPLRLVSFSAVDDSDGFHAAPSLDQFDEATFSCGLFELTKEAASPA